MSTAGKSSGIGGQAVLEGIMMKNQDVYSVGVRKPDGEIEVHLSTYEGNRKQKTEKDSDCPGCGKLCGFSGSGYEMPDFFRQLL